MTWHAFTIDVEDWNQMMLRRLTGAYGIPSTATVSATHRLLDVLDETRVRATFFVVGVLTETFPELVQEIHRRGHEIASHSYTHRPIFTLSRAEFRDDLKRSIDTLSDLTGAPVRGFRAPEFSVGDLNHWCFDIMVELGMAYDSSVFPIEKVRYGIPDAPHKPFRMKRSSGSLLEFPLATSKWRGRRIPLAGGTYYRFLPLSTIRQAMSGLESESVLYFHPYEFHTRVLKLESAAFSTRLRPAYLKYRLLHNFRTGHILRVLKPLLAEFQFRPLAEICESLQHEL